MPLWLQATAPVPAAKGKVADKPLPASDGDATSDDSSEHDEIKASFPPVLMTLSVSHSQALVIVVSLCNAA